MSQVRRLRVREDTVSNPVFVGESEGRCAGQKIKGVERIQL